MPRQIIRKRTRMRIGLRQKTALIDLVEQNFQFAAGKHPTASNKNARWRNIALSLNKIGPVYKTTEEWRAAFNGMKGKIKEKIKGIIESKLKYNLDCLDEEDDAKASDPDSSDTARLTKEDYRIIKLCRIKGLDKIEEMGGNVSKKNDPIKKSSIASPSSEKPRENVIPSVDQYLSQGGSSPMAPNIDTSNLQINDSGNVIRRRVKIYSENPAVAKSLRLQEENNRNQLVMITVLKQIVEKQQTIIDLMQKQ